MKKKKLLSLSLAVTMLFGSAAALPEGVFISQTEINASAEETYKSGYYEYEILEDHTVKIVSYNGNEAYLNIPEYLDDKKVTVIGEGVFENHAEIKSISIPNSITQIESSAFKKCTNLLEVSIPKSISKVSWGPFADCEKLKTVKFETGIKEIPECIFSECTGIEEIIIPDTVTTINESAFSNAENLKKVDLSSKLTKLCNNAFRTCKSLTEITIPDTVTVIGDGGLGDNGCFEDCTSLSKVILSRRLTTLNCATFMNCTSLREIFIPKSIKQAYDYYGAGYWGPFDDCTNLKTVVFEDGIKEIPSNLFSSCPGIEEITIPDTVTVINDGAFRNAVNLKKVNLSSKLTKLCNNAFKGCKELTEIDIPNTVTEIGDGGIGDNGCFENCINLSKVTLSNRLVKLECATFMNCTSLTEINIPKSIKEAYDYYGEGYWGPFDGCTNLKKVTFEEGIKEIPSNLFTACPGIEEITIPDTVTIINDCAFRNAENLTKVNLSKSLESIENKAFSGCKSLSEIELPNSVTSMGEYIFNNCTSLKTATLPNKRVNITKGTFNGCASLEKVDIPVTVEAVRESAFEGCESLKEITLPDGVTTIENYAFLFCSSLKEFTVPFSTTYIGDEAFNGCSALEKVTMPDNEIKLGGNATFYNCENLKDVKLSEKITKIPDYMFANCYDLEAIRIPYCVESIEKNAFENTTALSDIYISDIAEDFADDIFSYPGNLTIHGVKNSAANTYADDNDITFVADYTTPISAATVKFDKEAYVYTGKAIKPVLTLSLNENDLVNGKDYTISYKDNTKIGKATITITGKGKYCSTMTQIFYITYDISKATVTGIDDSYIYTGDYIEPIPTVTLNGKKLTSGIDYSVSYDDNKYYGTATVLITGKGSYSGKIEKPFQITKEPVNISEASIYDLNDSYTFTGNAIEPDFTLEYDYDNLEKGKDYTVTYKNNVNVGTATVIIKGKGAYKGQITKTFKITEKSISKATITISKASYTYDGKAKKPTVTVVLGTKALVNGTDYTVAYKNNVKAGTATVTVTGKGNYSGSLKANFKIKNRTASDIKKTRLAGDNRYSTATKLSGTMYKTANTVILATGLSYQDALVAVPLASAYNVPLLLATEKHITAQTEAELKRLNAKNVIVVSTNGAIGEKAKAEFKAANYNMTYIEGKTCFETAAKVAKALQDKTKKAPDTIFFATDSAFADALSASPVAAIKNAPIMYLKNTGSIDKATADYLKSVKGKVKNAYIIGGDGVISNAMMKNVATALGLKSGKTVVRVAGANRYSTCVEVNNKFKDVLTGTGICVAKGLDFPDALAGGVYAAKTKQALFLADGKKLQDCQNTYLKSKNAGQITVFGGTGAVPDDLVKLIAQASV